MDNMFKFLVLLGIGGFGVGAIGSGALDLQSVDFAAIGLDGVVGDMQEAIRYIREEFGSEIKKLLEIIKENR